MYRSSIKKEQFTKQTKAFRYISVITNVNERLLLSQKEQATIFFLSYLIDVI